MRKGLGLLVRIIVDSKCTGCETCVNICPVNVYEIKNGKAVPVRVEDCLICRTCESQCPEGAIQVMEDSTIPVKVETPPQIKAARTKTKLDKKTKKPSTKQVKSKSLN